MTNSEMLKEVIQRAIDGGWLQYQTKVNKVSVHKYRYEDDFADDLRQIVYTIEFDGGAGLMAKCSVYELIFNHNFAKALWGELYLARHQFLFDVNTEPGEVAMYQRERDDRLLAWQYHLQQMVISENPIKYAYDNKKGKE